MKENFIYLRACVSSVLVSYGLLCSVCCVVDLDGCVGIGDSFRVGYMKENEKLNIFISRLWSLHRSMGKGKGKGWEYLDVWA